MTHTSITPTPPARKQAVEVDAADLSPHVMIEIESFAKSPPKVRVRVVDTDSEQALVTALDVYERALDESGVLWSQYRDHSGRLLTDESERKEEATGE